MGCFGSVPVQTAVEVVRSPEPPKPTAASADVGQSPATVKTPTIKAASVLEPAPFSSLPGQAPPVPSSVSVAGVADSPKPVELVSPAPVLTPSVNSPHMLSALRATTTPAALAGPQSGASVQATAVAVTAVAVAPTLSTIVIAPVASTTVTPTPAVSTSGPHVPSATSSPLVQGPNAVLNASAAPSASASSSSMSLPSSNPAGTPKPQFRVRPEHEIYFLLNHRWAKPEDGGYCGSPFAFRSLVRWRGPKSGDRELRALCEAEAKLNNPSAINNLAWFARDADESNETVLGLLQRASQITGCSNVVLNNLLVLAIESRGSGAGKNGMEFRQFKRLGDLDLACAMFNASTCLRFGLGGAQKSKASTATAILMDEKNTALGSSDAMFEIAESLRRRMDGYKYDVKRAFQLLMKAAALHNSDAEFWLANAYDKAQGTSPDPIRARALFLRSAHQKNKKAEDHLKTCKFKPHEHRLVNVVSDVKCDLCGCYTIDFECNECTEYYGECSLCKGWTKSIESAASAGKSKPSNRPVCKFYAKSGKCKFGKRCRNVHERGTIARNVETRDSDEDSSDDRDDDAGPKAKIMCRFYAAGYCRAGSDCVFAHPTAENKDQPVKSPISTSNGESSSDAKIVTRVGPLSPTLGVVVDSKASVRLDLCAKGHTLKLRIGKPTVGQSLTNTFVCGGNCRQAVPFDTYHHCDICNAFDVCKNCIQEYQKPSSRDEIASYGGIELIRRRGTKWVNRGVKQPKVEAEVWERGISKEARAQAAKNGTAPVAKCYLCRRLLKRELRLCVCPTLLPGKVFNAKDCAGCGAWQIEHVIPKSSGEEYDVRGNLLPACHRCNCNAWKAAHSLEHCVEILGLPINTSVGHVSGLLPETAKQIGAELMKKPRLGIEQLEKLVDLTFPFEELKYDPYEVSQGGSGVVRKATWLAPGAKEVRSVAVKSMRVIDPRAQKSFLRELFALQKTLDHPHIISCFGAFRPNGANGPLCIVLPWYPCHLGEYLATLTYCQECIDQLPSCHCITCDKLLCATDGPTHKLANQQHVITDSLPSKANKLWSVLKQIAAALEYMHSFPRPMLHRDIKAPNILVDKNGNVVLTDFGEARVHGSVTRIGAGTVQYMEDTEEATPAQDVYSFGKVIERDLLPFVRNAEDPMSVATVGYFEELVELCTRKGTVRDPRITSEKLNDMIERYVSELELIESNTNASPAESKSKSGTKIEPALWNYRLEKDAVAIPLTRAELVKMKAAGVLVRGELQPIDKRDGPWLPAATIASLLDTPNSN